MRRGLKILLIGLLLSAGAAGGAGLFVASRGLRPVIAERFGRLPLANDATGQPEVAADGFDTLWVSDFKGNRILAFNKQGETVREQYMANNTAAEYVTVAVSNGQPCTA